MVTSDKVHDRPPLSPLGVINVFATQLEFTARDIQTSEERLRKIVEKGVISSNNTPRVVQCLSVLLIFEAELAYRMREWQLIPKVIQVCIPSPFAYWGFSNQLFLQKVSQCQASPSDTFEAITDMLVSVTQAGRIIYQITQSLVVRPGLPTGWCEFMVHLRRQLTLPV